MYFMGADYRRRSLGSETEKGITHCSQAAGASARLPNFCTVLRSRGNNRADTDGHNTSRDLPHNRGTLRLGNPLLS